MLNRAKAASVGSTDSTRPVDKRRPASTEKNPILAPISITSRVGSRSFKKSFASSGSYSPLITKRRHRCTFGDSAMAPWKDRKSVVWGQSVYVRVDLGRRRTIKKKII